MARRGRRGRGGGDEDAVLARDGEELVGGGRRRQCVVGLSRDKLLSLVRDGCLGVFGGWVASVCVRR